jgi:hypothetical protein
MARRSFRDRFWSPPVARAVTAPSSILLAGGAAAVAAVATFPLSLAVGILAAAGAAVAAYGGRVLAAVPRDRRAERVDPFAVQEPWRRFVGDALAGRQRFEEAVRAMPAGPLRDRLDGIGARLDDGVAEIWRIARQGDALTAASSRIDLSAARAELATVEAQAQEPWAQGSRLQQTAEALRSQVASGERLVHAYQDAHDRLRLLDARMDEAVTRAIELSTGASTQGAGQVGGDVDGIVGEMEALRVALEEVDVADGPATGGTATATS